MIKEYTMEDILNAVNNIQKAKKKTSKSSGNKKDYDEKNGILPLNKQVKPGKSDILVLNQMIE